MSFLRNRNRQRVDDLQGRGGINTLRTDVGRDDQKLRQISVSPHRKTQLITEPLAEILPSLVRAIFKARCRGFLDQLFLYRSVVQRRGQTCYLHSATCQFRVGFHEVIAFTTFAVLGPRSVSYTTSF